MRSLPSRNEFEKLRRENDRRLHLYFRKYDPIIGDPEGEVVKRCEVVLDGVKYYLPIEMYQKEPLLKLVDGVPFETAISRMGIEPTEEAKADLLNGIMEKRLDYDYEFWAATCYTIQDKESKQDIKLIHNHGQRKLSHAFEMQRLAHRPIRVIVDKARQWGGSTDTEGYMMWHQTRHYRNWHSAIIAKVNNQAANIRAMVSKAVKNYPSEAGHLTLAPFEGMLNTKIIKERGCRITIASAENPENLRSYDFAMLHMSECATWPDTPTKSGDDLAQTLASTVPYQEGTMIVKESTAKGVGGYFHDEWLHAISSDNLVEGKDVPVFVAWFEIEMYKKTIRDWPEFLKSMSEYNWWQWEQGATFEGIKWYNDFKIANRWSDFQMKSEYPTTADESFQTKAGKYFTDFMLQYLRSTCCEPQFIGDIRGDAVVGEESLNNIHLEPRDGGNTEVLKIWIKPGGEEEGMRYKNRFVVIVDIGGLHYKSDNSVISVLDRKDLVNAHGRVERAALWYGHIDHDLLAWKAVQIATYYDNALLVIESNTLETKDQRSDDAPESGDHSFTVLNEISDVYDNLYIRNATPDKTKQKSTLKYGWHMNKKTKYQAYDTYRAHIRDEYFVEHSNDAVNEASYLEQKRDGKIEAAKGRHDDIQDTTAVGVYIATDPAEMDSVKYLPVKKKGQRKRPVSHGASTF